VAAMIAQALESPHLDPGGAGVTQAMPWYSALVR